MLALFINEKHVIHSWSTDRKSMRNGYSKKRPIRLSYIGCLIEIWRQSSIIRNIFLFGIILNKGNVRKGATVYMFETKNCLLKVGDFVYRER